MVSTIVRVLFCFVFCVFLRVFLFLFFVCFFVCFFVWFLSFADDLTKEGGEGDIIVVPDVHMDGQSPDFMVNTLTIV